jgi:nitrogen-specific signal transduction histidine kinase
MPIEDNVLNILNNLSEPVLLLDRTFTIVVSNHAANDYFNQTAEKILGHYCYEVIYSKDEPCWKSGNESCSVNEAFKTGTRSHSIRKLSIGDQSNITEVLATPLLNDKGESKYVIQEFRNVTKFLDLRGTLLLECSSCKRICDKNGNWAELDTYIHDHTGTEFSHSFCPECLHRLYPEIG